MRKITVRFCLLAVFFISTFCYGLELNLNNVDIRTFIKLIGEFTKTNYVIDPNVRGNVTVYSYKPIAAVDIDNVFKSILGLHGFSVIADKQVSYVVPTSDAKSFTRVINIGDVEDFIMDEYIIQHIPLKYYPPDTISQVLTPYISRGGQITVDARTNSIFVSETGKNVAKIKEIVSKIDVPSPPGREELRIYRLQNANAEDVASTLGQLLSRPRTAVRRGELPPVQPSIVSAKTTNSLLVHASPDDFDSIENIIGELDVLTNQVLIEAMIAEVTYEKTQELGIEWGFAESFSDGKYVGGIGGRSGRPLSRFAEEGGLAVGLYRGQPSLPFNISLNPGIFMNLYAKDSRFNILSTPQIMTTDNHEATINISENIPFVRETRFVGTGTGAASDTITSYDYRDVGIILSITPQISQDNYVRLKISQEVTKLLQAGEQPITAKRSVDTNLIVPNNRTVVLGGLVRDDTEKTTNKVPVLGDIPLLGRLFKRESDAATKTNLLIFITPRIITSFDEAEELRIEKEMILLEDKGF